MIISWDVCDIFENCCFKFEFNWIVIAMDLYLELNKPSVISFSWFQNASKYDKACHHCWMEHKHSRCSLIYFSIGLRMLDRKAYDLLSAFALDVWKLYSIQVKFYRTLRFIPLEISSYSYGFRSCLSPSHIKFSVSFLSI